MEPDKFEKHIKQSLDERKIKPSSNAWDRIADQLVEPETSKSKKLFWFSIAAGFIGILIISSIYFNVRNTPIVTDMELVETPKETFKTQDSAIEIKQNDVVKEKMVVSDEVLKKERGKQGMSTTPNIDNQIVLREKEVVELVKPALILNEEEKLINAKIAEIVEQVDFLEKNNQTVSSIEVDSLLRKAQKEILTDNIFNGEGNVDAMALLNEVEGELDQTFREQIFETLKKGFLKVRTAVVDRNN